MLKKKLLKKTVVIGMMATMITGCSQEVQTTNVDGLNSLGKIEVVSREEESGTRNVFAEKTGILDETTGKDKATDQSIVADSNETAYEKTAEDKNAIAYVSSGVELDDNKVKTVTIYGNDLTRSFYLAYKGELNDVEDDFVRYISTQGQEVVSEKYTAVAKPGSFLSDKAGGEIKIGGSTSATPLVKELADKYMEINPNAKITVTETDSGLMEAAEKFDIEQGVAFSLYAIHRIRGRMLDFLRKGQNDILMGEEQEEKFFTLQVAPDTAFEITDRNSLHSAVSMAVSRLPMKEQDVIRSVYLKEKTVAETANEMDVSTAYVYRLEKRGIHRLRGMLSKLMHERK